METVKKTLAGLGLKKQEIKIYLELISHESMTAKQIAKETGVDRTTCYDIMAKLQKEGIVSEIKKGKAKHFKALQPKDLLFHYQNKYSALETIMPELEKLTKKTSQPVTCELFVGKEGLINAVKDLVLSNKHYKAIGITEEYEEILGYFSKQFLRKINLSRIKEKGIVEKNAIFKPVKKGKYKYVQKLPSGTTIIYEDTVVFFIWQGNKTAIRIKNKEFKRFQEAQFDLLWKNAKPFKIQPHDLNNS